MPWPHCCGRKSLFFQEQRSISPRIHCERVVITVIMVIAVMVTTIRTTMVMMTRTHHHQEWRKPGGSPSVMFFSHRICKSTQFSATSLALGPLGAERIKCAARQALCSYVREGNHAFLIFIDTFNFIFIFIDTSISSSFPGGFSPHWGRSGQPFEPPHVTGTHRHTRPTWSWKHCYNLCACVWVCVRGVCFFVLLCCAC